MTVATEALVAASDLVVGFPIAGGARREVLRGVNVLSAEQDDLCWKFAKTGTETTRFDGVAWHESPSGSPILDRAVAWIDCTVEDVYTMGDHYFVLGRVDYLDADPDHDGLPPRPLVFFRGNIGGFSSET